MPMLGAERAPAAVSRADLAEAGLAGLGPADAAALRGAPPPPPPPPSRTKWKRRVPYPVLIGHAASLTPY